MKYGIIYKITNKINGKVYIGKTVQSFQRRCQSHRYKSCVAFNNAINSYGWDNFEKEEFICSLNEDYLSGLEEQAIKTFNSIVPNGYNIVKIDNGLNRYSQETKNKISEARKTYYNKLEIKPVAANKKEHIMVNNVPHKECPKCEKTLTLDNFNVNKGRWDKLHTYCRTCHRSMQAAYVPMSEEDFKKSYDDRQKAVSAGVRKSYEENPELRAKQAERKSKAIIGINLETGSEIEFISAKAAVQYGFCNKGISRSIKTGKPFMKHSWKFKQNV